MINRIMMFVSLFACLISYPIQTFAAEDSHDHHDRHEHKEHENQHDYDEHLEGGHSEHGHEDYEDSVIKVDKETQKIIGLTMGKVVKRSFGERIQVYGEIAQDSEKYTHLTSEHESIVDGVHIENGDIVDENDLLFTLKAKSGENYAVTAPHHGTIISMHVKKGDKVDSLKSLASLADLDQLRVSFDVFEKDLRFAKVGQDVEIESAAYPDKRFYGKIVYISPRIDKETQAIKIRAQVDNSEHFLRLGMFVTGYLIHSVNGQQLIVPQGAVQQINDEYVVFVPATDGFKSQNVLIGKESEGFVEVKKGLKEGDGIVTTGSFALKSELLKDAFGDGHAH